MMIIHKWRSLAIPWRKEWLQRISQIMLVDKITTCRGRKEMLQINLSKNKTKQSPFIQYWNKYNLLDREKEAIFECI